MAKNKIYDEIYRLFRDAREKIITDITVNQDNLTKEDLKRLYRITRMLDNIINKIP